MRESRGTYVCAHPRATAASREAPPRAPNRAAQHVVRTGACSAFASAARAPRDAHMSPVSTSPTRVRPTQQRDDPGPHAVGTGRNAMPAAAT
ncbi:hypothetical protein E2562_003872 [Oryza meyeriana var. granulata]|uniref:Uncharacterized protein n=1 Tax=Oryza meyeriana var. granulata TaxID=110450 RepID=A0A6G1CZF0_9ORYZ|nr:hypothetical protein E2562_003872 [Oryza meyeriana var. granulata]